MKKLVYILLIVLFISCSNKSNAPSASDMNFSLPEVFNEKIESFEYEKITTEKLQDYLDLSILKKNYPEFSTNIDSQLQALSKDTIDLITTMQNVKIKNVQLIDQVIVSDSTKNLKLSFDIVSKDFIKKDTITANIKTSTIRLDNEQIIKTKVIFFKE